MKSMLIALLLSLMVAGPVDAKAHHAKPTKVQVHKKTKNYVDSVPPRTVTAAIKRASRATGVNTNVLAGYASLESSFKSKANNPKGAKGLVQITPKTFRYLARTYGPDHGITKANPFNPYHSAVLAAEYIKENGQNSRYNF